MKRPNGLKQTPSQNKRPKLFKLMPAMIAQIEKAAETTHRTQTKIVELALAEYFAVKR